MENHHRILHIRVSLGSKLWLQQTILIVLEKFPPAPTPRKKILPVKNKNKSASSLNPSNSN